MGQDVRSPRGPRCVALVGPFQSGKTTLLEAIMSRTGAIPKAGSVDAGTSHGDASPEARHHKMSVELSVATTNFLGDSYTFIDCPGSVEFIHDMRAALPAVDAAVVVCEADEKKVPQLQLILRELEDLKIPRFLFLNKIDKADKRVRETLKLLQPASRVPLVLRQIPIWNNDIVIGFVDLALERADLLGKRRLLHAQLLRRARDVALVSDGDEIAEVAQFHGDIQLIWKSLLSYI